MRLIGAVLSAFRPLPSLISTTRQQESWAERTAHWPAMRLRVELEVTPEEVPLATELVALLRCGSQRSAMRPNSQRAATPASSGAIAHTNCRWQDEIASAWDWASARHWPCATRLPPAATAAAAAQV